jgi:hypothetical protein
MSYTIGIGRDPFGSRNSCLLVIHDEKQQLIHNETSSFMGVLEDFKRGFQLAERLYQAKAAKVPPIADAIRAARLHQSRLAADRAEGVAEPWQGTNNGFSVTA